MECLLNRGLLIFIITSITKRSLSTFVKYLNIKKYVMGA